jgi:hypothetical protein
MAAGGRGKETGVSGPGYYGDTHAYCMCLGIVDEASGEGLLTGGVRRHESSTGLLALEEPVVGALRRGADVSDQR